MKLLYISFGHAACTQADGRKKILARRNIKIFNEKNIIFYGYIMESMYCSFTNNFTFY